MNTTIGLHRISAAIAAVGVTFLIVWAISDYALAPNDSISFAGPIGQGVLPVAFVTN